MRPTYNRQWVSRAPLCRCVIPERDHSYHSIDAFDVEIGCMILTAYNFSLSLALNSVLLEIATRRSLKSVAGYYLLGISEEFDMPKIRFRFEINCY